MAAQPVITKINELAASQGYSIEEIHATSKIEKVPIAQAKIDRDYQREPTQRLVDDIADNWDEVSAELLLMSDRGPRDPESEVPGGLFVVNGQHRMLGARKAGVDAVWARVIDLSKAHDPGAIEALFRLRTNKRMGDKPLERFKAQVRAGDPESNEIVKLLAQFDAEVNEIPQTDTGINAISTVERLYRVDDGALLRLTLEVINAAYKKVGGKHSSAALMTGTAWWLVKHYEDGDLVRLTQVMGVTGVAALNQRAIAHKAVMGGPIWQNTYRALVELYNENLSVKQRLEWRLSGASAFSGATASGWAGSKKEPNFPGT